MAERLPVDVMLVSPGTTAGWRRVDADFARLLGDIGLSVAMATTDFRLARHLRRTVALTDLAEAAAMRHALTRALRHYRPRAIVYSSTQAPMLQPAARLRTAAVRFDALTVVNRPGRLNALQHRLERRALRRMTVLLPSGLDPARRIPAGFPAQRTVALLLPIAPGPGGDERRPVALCYAGNPDKKGLDLIAQAWTLAAPEGHRLIVTGIEADAGRDFLHARGVPVPAGLDWAGAVSAAHFRELTATAEIFISASRFEDYGLAQLEAIADGALLATTPSPGPYEALPIAQELDNNLVAQDATPTALATTIKTALTLPEQARRTYRQKARELLEPYSEQELRRRIKEEVLPPLGL